MSGDNELLDRVCRIESKLCNLADYIGCDVRKDSAKNRALHRVTVRRCQVTINDTSATIADVVVALKASEYTGQFALVLAGHTVGHITFNPHYRGCIPHE